MMDANQSVSQAHRYSAGQHFACDPRGLAEEIGSSSAAALSSKASDVVCVTISSRRSSVQPPIDFHLPNPKTERASLLKSRKLLLYLSARIVADAPQLDNSTIGSDLKGNFLFSKSLKNGP
jgi:hypothetical protein